MTFIPRYIMYLPTIFLVCLISSGIAFAAPTAEQAQQFIHQKNIPHWKSAVSKMQKLRQNPLDREAAALWNELDRETDDKTGKAPISRITTLKDGKDLFDIASWLKWRILAEHADARYSYIYASHLIHMKDQSGGFEKEAAIYFFLARLSLAIDGARCVDQTSPNTIAMRYESGLRPLLEKINQLTNKEKGVAILEALSIEHMRGERPPKGYLCMNGTRAISRAFALGRKMEPLSSSHTGVSDQLGTPATVDTSGLEPELISTEAWMERRNEILDKYLKDAIAIL